MDIVAIAIGCGIVAVGYGIVTSRQVLAASPGNARMQEIAKAIQEGAGAYLTKQYPAIAIVGVIVAETPRRGRFETIAPEVLAAGASRPLPVGDPSTREVDLSRPARKPTAAHWRAW